MRADLNAANPAALASLHLEELHLPAGAQSAAAPPSFGRILQAEVARVRDLGGRELSAAPSSSSPSGVGAEQKARITEAAKDFEGLLLYTLLKQMWSTVPKSPYFDSGLSTQFYREMYLDEVAKRVADSGGIGIAQSIERELMDWAARTTTPAEQEQQDPGA
jgi:Rod binding domain-containing protein